MIVLASVHFFILLLGNEKSGFCLSQCCAMPSSLDGHVFEDHLLEALQVSYVQFAI